MRRCGEIATLLCLGLILLQGQPVLGAVGGGSRSAGSSSASRSPGARSYRLSGGYSGMSSRRYNYYRSSSYYLSYIPTVRSTRSYTPALMGGVYWSYYTRYHYYSNTAASAHRRIPADNTTLSVCANYAAGENGTYMGLFTCPLDFEPATFTACCGDDYEEFCCEPEKTNTVTVTILAIAFIVAMVISAVVRYKRPGKYKRGGRIITRVGPDTTQPPPQGAQPTAPLSGQYLMPPHTVHPQQQEPPLPPSVAQQNALPPAYSENNYTTASSFNTVYGLPATAPPSYAASMASNTVFSNPAYTPTAPTKY